MLRHLIVVLTVSGLWVGAPATAQAGSLFELLMPKLKWPAAGKPPTSPKPSAGRSVVVNESIYRRTAGAMGSAPVGPKPAAATPRGPGAALLGKGLGVDKPAAPTPRLDPRRPYLGQLKKR